MIEPRKCIKCGQVKAATEFYEHSGNTCKECLRKGQRERNTEKKTLRAKSLEERRYYNYGGATVWIKGVQVMRKGVLVGQEGQDWWEEKIRRHEKWRRRKKKKEENYGNSIS